MHIGGKWVTVTLHILTESLPSLAYSLKLQIFYTNFHVFFFYPGLQWGCMMTYPKIP